MQGSQQRTHNEILRPDHLPGEDEGSSADPSETEADTLRAQDQEIRETNAELIIIEELLCHYHIESIRGVY